MLRLMFFVVFLFIMSGLMSGCSLSNNDGNLDLDRVKNIPVALIKKLTNPVFDKLGEDANTTLVWVNSNESLTETEKLDARRCPDAVNNFNRLRMEVLDMVDSPGGFKGVIYAATVRKYGGDPREMFANELENLVSACSGLIVQDSDLMMKIFVP